MTRLQVAERLREIGRLLRFREGKRFQARAYESAAEALDNVSDASFAGLLESAELTRIPHVGEAIAGVVERLHRDGTTRLLEELRAEFPSAIVEMTNVAGVTLARARALETALGIQSLDALELACVEGRVRTVAGFGAKTEAKILAGVRAYRTTPHEIALVEALEWTERLVSYMRESASAVRVEPSGGVRRCVETTHEIAVCVATDDAAVTLDHAARFPALARVEEHHERQLTGRITEGIRLRVDVAARASFGSAWVRSTGSSEHVHTLARMASSRETSIDEASDERDVYAALGLPLIPPELREGEDEFVVAKTRGFDDLVTRADIVGAIHCHTVYSDGRDSIEDMARAAHERGFRYITISDHSPTAHYAGGVTVQRLQEQWDEIDRVQSLVPEVRILRATESDILEDGSLDYPDNVLERLDVVIASIHARNRMDAPQMTARLVKAMKHPCFKVWGHPLGRLILRRGPVACDVEAVLDAVAESRAAIEINGDPYRLDLEPRWLRAARSRGISFVISSDAHSTRGLASVAFGVSMARRGGVRRAEVLNALDVDEFLKLVRPAR